MQNKKRNFKMRKVSAGNFNSNTCMIRSSCKLKIKCGKLAIIDPKIKALKVIK